MGNQVFRSPKVSRCLENHKSPLGPPSTLASQSGWQAHQPGKGGKGVNSMVVGATGATGAMNATGATGAVVDVNATKSNWGRCS